MKKKLKIQELRVQNFITELAPEMANAAKGGDGWNDCGGHSNSCDGWGGYNGGDCGGGHGGHGGDCGGGNGGGTTTVTVSTTTIFVGVVFNPSNFSRF